MEREQIRISVRNLVEFILRSGDIDNRRASLDTMEAMQAGSRLHRKIQKKMGSTYHAEVPLNIIIEEENYELGIWGRADGIIIEETVTIDEIKGVYLSLDLLEEPVKVHLAQLYEVKGEDEKAAGLYKEYIDENQDNPTALVCLGGMELEKGNYDSAINYLKMALDLDAGSQKQEAQRNLILAYEQSGDFASAKSEMEDYTKNYPNDEEAAREYLFLMTR
mgnify:CR=1 FL=1